MKIPKLMLALDIETSEQAQDDKISPITVASTVTSDGEEMAWFSDPADSKVVGMRGNRDGETWVNYSPGERPLAPLMGKGAAIAMLKYIEEKQKLGYSVCAWNGASFDMKMIGHLADNLELAGKIALEMYDPMYQILTQKGFPLALASVQKGLGLSQAKSMDGKDAPEAWKNGQFQKVIGYVIGDSQITIQVMQAIAKADGIKWITKSGKPSSVVFRKFKTVAECLLDPDVDQSWQQKPLNRKQMVAWIPDSVRNKAKGDVVKAEAKERKDASGGARPILLVLSGPSGSGKSVLCDEIIRTIPSIGRSVTTTTRQPRKGEVEGVDYHFVTPEKFDKMAIAGDFLEWAEVYGNKYGSSKVDVSTKLAKGQDVIMIVDSQGAQNIRKFIVGLPTGTAMKFCFADVFVMPPSIEDLRKRLVARGKDDPKTIETRLANAAREITQSSRYKYTILNDSIDKAWDKLRSIVIAERCLSFTKP
jgi:guanylate kinase